MDRPNVLLLFTDQQRWDTIAEAGFPFMVTPHLDALAREGVLFKSAYTPFPVCTPARASVVTGCSVRRHGCWGNHLWIPDDTDTWPRIFTEAGYDTRAIGKMHSHPWRNPTGFARRAIAEDKYYYYVPDDYSQWLESKGYKRPTYWDDPEERAEYQRKSGAVISRLPEELHIDSFVGAQAVEAIREAASGGTPFCYWVSFNSPHAPHDPPQRFLDMYKDREIPAPARHEGEPFDKSEARYEWQSGLEKFFAMTSTLYKWTDEQIKERRAHYYATITLVDHWIGRIIDTLKETGQYNNTIILFTSDHGDLQGDHNLLEKGVCYEPAVRIPFLVHYPARFSPGVSDEFVTLMDIAPSFLNWAGLRVPEGMEGADLTPLLEKSGEWQSRDAVFSECGPMTMIRTREWKLILEPKIENRELYNMESDPEEFHNLYSEESCRKIRDELAGRIATWRTQGERLFAPEDMLPMDFHMTLFPEWQK